MSIRFGVLELVTAAKHQPCVLKEHCTKGGVIHDEEDYLQVIKTRMVPKGGMVEPERDPDLADQSFDQTQGARRRIQLRRWYTVSRYHIDCFAFYCHNLSLFKPFKEGKKARPTDPKLALLPPELKEMRRKWQKERSRMIKLALNARDHLEELQYCNRAAALRTQIANTGVPLHSAYYPPGFPEVQNRHICPAATTPRLHQLGEDYHCTDCGKCYARNHLHP